MLFPLPDSFVVVEYLAFARSRFFLRFRTMRVCLVRSIVSLVRLLQQHKKTLKGTFYGLSPEKALQTNNSLSFFILSVLSFVCSYMDEVLLGIEFVTGYGFYCACGGHSCGVCT